MFKKAVFLFFFLHVCVCMQAKDYFVKMNGDGSGSSWEDALSPLDFAEKIDAGEQDATFHLAEGTYYPMLEFKRTIVFENMYSRAYQVKANTKIIGGYPPSPEKGDVSNPDRFKTTFSVDYQGNDIVKFAKSSFGNGMDSIVVTNDGDNDEYIFEVVKPNLNFTMYGVQLKHAKHGAICAQEECAIDLKKCFFMDNGGAGVLAENPSIKLNMDSCRSYRTAFKVGLSTVYAPESREVTLTNSVIQNSGMYKNNAGGGVYFAGGVVKNCLFYKCCSNAAAAIFSVGVSDENSYVSNCTFIGNRCYSQATVWFLGQSRDTLVNCTMVGNLATDIPERSNFVKDEQFCLVQGNYIVGEPMFSMVDDPDENVMIKNNVLTHKATGFFGELDLDDSNILLDEKTALEGLGMSSSFDFTVVDTSLNYVPLLVDVLADKSIRFPRVVGTDARGVERCELTCPGAYEIRNCDEPQCLPDTTIASPSDTIYAGQMFLGKTYAYACRIDSIFEVIQDENGCDKVIIHSLIVKPDPTKDKYYVKTQKQGKGDGSTWTNAMDGVTFARTLPDVPEGVTFHVAAGTYDIGKFQAANKAETGSAVYINNPVSIIGGYPANATGNETPKPSANKTLLTNGILQLTGYARNPAYDLVFDGLYFDLRDSEGIINTISAGAVNVVVKNCVVLPTSTCYRAAVCMIGTNSLTMENDTVYGSNCGDCVFIHCYGDCSIKNCVLLDAQGSGVNIDAADTVTIENCLISGAGTGVNTINAGANFLDVKESTIINNRLKGINSTEITHLKNNRIGIDDNGNVAGNRIGVYLSYSSNNIVEGNIIAGNDSIGLLLGSTGSTTIKGNYIGTDKNFRDLGNKWDGIYIDGDQTVTFPSSLDSANYIGFNKGHGVCLNYGRRGFDLTYNYIGVSPQGTPMPNGKYGIYMKNPTSSTKTTKGNVIGFNGEGGIFISDYSNNNITENLFFGTKGSAITKSNNVFVNLSVPSIVQAKKDGDFIRIEGTTDTSIVSTVEIFYTNGDPQTAHEFLGSTETDNTGAFTFSVPVKSLAKYGGSICFSATAIYPYSGTSYLSDPFCACFPDTTLANDTIQVGASFLGVTYTTVGVHDSIFESIQHGDDCESVVMHRLVVNPDPTRNEYYVKMERHGKGDGSSWENAMNGTDFATCLPLAPNGATFYVAEGTYKPVYDYQMRTPSDPKLATYLVKEGSNVTIQGGYPAQPEEGAVSDPSKYQAIFDGDILGNDVIDETLDEDGFPSLERTNGEDNVNTMFSPEIENILVLDGVVVKNAGSAVSGDGAYSVITLKNSSFENNGSAVKLNEEYGGEKELRIYSCSFVKNTASLFDVDGQSNIVMDSVIIEYNLNSTILNAHYNGTYTIDDTLIVDGDTTIILKIAGANLSMNRVHVTKNKGMILVDKYSVKVENSEFANNQVAYVFNLGSPRSNIYTAEISNCKFLQNKGKAILADSYVLSVDNCLFEGNKGNNLIQITGTSSLRTPNLITNSIVKENESTGSYGSLIYCSSSSNLYMHNNLFTGNVIPENSLLYCYSLDSIAVTNSTFQETDAEYLVEFVGSKKKLIEGNTITRNNTTGYLFHLQSGSTVTTFKNNTVCSNECQSSLIFSREDPSYLYNNTIVGNKLSNTSKLIDCDDYHTFVHTIGNIILGNSVPNGKTEYLAIRGGSKRNYNIMSYTETDSTNHHCHELPDESNIMSIYDLNAVNNAYPSGVLCRDFLDYASRLKYSPEEILTTLFEGTYDKETNLFTPKLMNNGGPTSTLALKTDKLPDGTSIRFPLTGTVVTTDQRGVERLDSTCMGAYEAVCLPDTTKAELPDTIYAGEEFLGVTYAYACRIDSIYETLQNINGCDSVVMHTLIVKPDPTKFNYYVKTERHGTGDGSSWENAMDGTDFATYLPLAPDGATFYVAEGTYKPKYDMNLSIPSDSSKLCYTINSNITIRGGYPNDATGTNIVNEPDKYKTEFSGDIRSNDVVDITKDNDGQLSFLIKNNSENAKYLFYIPVHKNAQSTFDGVIFSHSDHDGIYVYGESANAFNANFDRVTFENNFGYAVYSTSGKGYIHINRSTFKNNSGGIYSYYSNVEVKNSLFEGNETGDLISITHDADSDEKKCTLNIDSVSFTKNSGQIYTHGDLSVKNTTFESNTLKSSLINTTASATFLNTKFTKNQIGEYGDIIGNYGDGETHIENCSFKDNVSGSNLINANNGLYVKKSFISNNQATRNIFNTYKLTLLSDTIEMCKSIYIAIPCQWGCHVDSCLIRENNSSLFLASKSSTDIFNFKLLNSKIDGNIGSGGAIKAVGDSVNIHRTIFKGNNFGDLIRVENAIFDFGECLCDSNIVSSSFLFTNNSKPNICNSTLVNNKVGAFLIQNSAANGTGAILTNNTIVSNECISRTIYCGVNSKTTLVNNTIIGNTTQSLLSCDFSGTCKGNILYGNVTPGGIYYLDAENTFNNIMELDTLSPSMWDKSNIISDHTYNEKVEKCTKFDYSTFKNYEIEIMSLFEGTYNNETGLFTPVLEYRGGFTPVVALKSDHLPNGTSIRFPLSETTVTTDQRGVARLDSTCMGAYELTCDLIVTQIKDTIQMGNSYTFGGVERSSSITTPGDYYFENTLTSVMGCDSIVKLDLHVYVIDTTQTTGTICLGSDYTLDGWNIQTTGYEPGSYTFYRSLDKENTEELILNIVKTNSVSIEDLEVVSPFCPGGSYGRIEFAADWEDMTESPYITVYNGEGRTLYNEPLNNYVRFSGLPADNYQVRIAVSESNSCFKDTVFNLVMKDVDSMSAIGPDTLYTSCVEKPNASATIELFNYHPSFDLRLDGKLIKRYGRTPNCRLLDGERMGDNYKAMLQLDSMAVGKHTIRVVDYCGNGYDVFTFVVVGPDPATFEVLSLDGNLKCSGDYGSVSLRRKGSEGSMIELSSDLFKETYSFDEGVMDMKIENLPGGEYTLHITNGDKSCPDGQTETITIKRPQPLNVDLMVNGIVCQDAVITAYATGENENYTYTWIKPDGQEITTSSNTLANVGAGRYKCVVKDSEGCSTAEGEAFVSEIENLSELKLISVTQDETCFGTDNAEVVVIYYDNNEHQAVTCQLTNKNTGEVVESVTSMLYWGGFHLQKIQPGDYHISLRYGTEDCNLDLKEVTRDITIKAKAKPLVIGTPVVKNVTCLSQPNGQIDFDVTGWEKGYTAEFVSKSVQPVSVSADSTAHFTFKGVSKGEYLFRVNDDCKVKDEAITIKVDAIEPYELDMEPVKTSLQCARSNDGEVVLNVSGGDHGNAVLSCNSILSETIEQDGPIRLTNLTKGNYTVVYKSLDNTCPDKETLDFTIEAPELLKAKFSVSGLGCDDMKLTATVSGEEKPYMFHWIKNGKTSLITHRNHFPFLLKMGDTIHCTIWSENRCDTIQQVICIPKEEEMPNLAIVSKAKQERCYGGNDAEISVTTTIAQRLTYSVPVTIGLKLKGDENFKTVNVVTDKTASHVFSDLAPGTYIVKSHFGTEGCSAGFITVYDTVEVEPLHEMSTLAMEKHDRTCLNENNGYIAFTVDGWSDSHRTWTTNELSILGQTITFPMKRIMPYKVEGQVAYFRIDNPEENKDIKLWINDACGNNFITQPQRVNKKVSEYVVAPLLTNNKLDCNYSETGWAILAVKGGYYGGNTFYREGDEANAVSLSAGKAISVTGLGAGIHTFHYKSTEENCTDESTYQLLVAPRNPLSFNTSLAGEECKDRKIVAEVTGGNTPVEVAWYSEKSLIKKDQGDTHELQSVGAGVFHYTITDAKGCEYKSDAIPANLYDPETDNLAISGVKADSTSCSNIEDGVVNVTYTGNDYQSDLFVILQGSAKTDTIRADKEEGTVALQNLASGQYNISLRYAAAGVCPTNSNAEQSVRLFSPDKLDVSVKNHDVVCDVVHGGAVSAYIQGGTPEYTVAWYLLDETSATPLENHKSELKDTLRGLSVKNSYFCKITDRNGCVSTSDTVTIGTQPMPDLNAITVDKIAVEDESCYHGNNGSVFVAYTNYTTNLPLKLLLYDEEGNPLTGVSDNHIDGIIETKDIAPGNYMLYLDVDFTDEGCENSLSPRLLENIHVESVKEPLSLKDISVVKPTCLTKPNGKASFVVSGWHDKDTVTLTIAGEREIYEPSEVDGETALFNIDNLKGGDLTITVSDVCGNSVSQQPTYGGITELGLEVGLTYTNLKCSYSTNGFAEIKVNGGVKDSLYLCMFSVKNGESTARDTVMNPSGTVRFENLEPNDFRFHLYTSVKNCPDVSTVGVVVKAPEPIVFDKAIEGVVCENTRSGEINFVPHRRGEAVKYDNKEVSNNLIDEIYFGEYDTYFPHVTSLSITGKGLSALEMDTVMIESISYGSFQNSGGFDYDEDDEVEEEASCEREVNGLCVAPKKDPLTSLWREKGGVYQYPRYWVGMQSLPGTTYYVKATDDSACVFIDSFNILPPDYKTLSIDNVFYDANAAICDAEKRRVELKVSGGWGDYQYIFLPDHETEGSSGLADSQTYIAGDSTWYENGKGFYRSYILDPDKYTIIVMDKKGCKKEYSQKIEVRSNIMVGGRSMIDPCGSDSTNMIKVKATRSSWYADYSPYEYQLRYEDTSLGERYLAPTKTDSVILYDVPIGKIGVFAYDKNGCSGYTNIVVKSSESLFEFNVSTFDQSAAKCYNEPSGLLRFYVMGANPPYRSLTLDGETLKDYELMHVDWAKNDTLFRLPDEKGFRMFDSISIKGLLGGEHVLTIIDSLGCRKEHKFTIEQPDELTLSISASSVCPDGEEGRIVAERTTGGTSPYEYSFDQETGFTDKQFLESKLGVERSMYVKDANGCVAKSSNTAAVDASISWGDVSPDVLVSSWQNFDDVLAFIDMTTYDNPGGKIKYDSATVKPYGIEVLNNGKASDSIFFEVVDPAIYTYGIPDSVEYILLWNNDTIWGPSWGVPTDIAAGVRSPEVYKKLKQDIDARKKKLNEGLENLIKNFKKKENPTLAETEKFLDDSTSFALRLDSIRSEERQNCTIEMIKGHFKRLMDESVIKRMTFVRLQSSIYDLESLNDGDSLLFRYNFTHTVYLSNCDMSTDYNFSSESLYGIRVSENGFNPYKVYAKRDIIEFEVSPNPASPNEECSIYLVLSRKTTPAIMVHNMVGKELQNSLNISEPEEVKEDGEIVYRYNITGLRLAFSAVITVRTDRDAASKVVIVN